ncbi:hypothetical protein [Streptomyces sp. DSM 15324]|uniref:hypothetical protein n=1 Tax=Streptomyces sp. DSM 15324 TaxID=1739111 RepID=UPI0018FEAB96|nr:hypothetical protein [Streptomyces sp. DSM 15324]
MTTTTAVGLAPGFRPDGGVRGVLATMLLLLVYAVSVSWIFAPLTTYLYRSKSRT